MKIVEQHQQLKIAVAFMVALISLIPLIAFAIGQFVSGLFMIAPISSYDFMPLFAGFT